MDRFQYHVHNPGLAINDFYEYITRQTHLTPSYARSPLPGFVENGFQWNEDMEDKQFDKFIWFYNHKDALGYISGPSFHELFMCYRLDPEENKKQHQKNVLQWAIHEEWKVKPCFAICEAPWQDIEAMIVMTRNVLGMLVGIPASEIVLSVHLMQPVGRRQSAGKSKAGKRSGSGGGGGPASGTRKRKKQPLSAPSMPATAEDGETKQQEDRELFSVWITCLSYVVFPSIQAVKCFVHGTLGSFLEPRLRPLLHVEVESAPLLGFNFHVQHGGYSYIYHVQSAPTWIGSIQSSTAIDRLARSASEEPVRYLLEHCPYICMWGDELPEERIPYPVSAENVTMTALRKGVRTMFKPPYETMQIPYFMDLMFSTVILACKEKEDTVLAEFADLYVLKGPEHLFEFYIYFVRGKLGLPVDVDLEADTIHLSSSSSAAPVLLASSSSSSSSKPAGRTRRSR